VVRNLLTCSRRYSMSADVAAGWALSRSQCVSVVPMIQCRPQGMTKRTDFSVRRMSPV